MGISKALYKTMDNLKPLLVKVIPLSFLQEKKRQYINWSTTRLKNIKIEQFDKDKYPSGINLIGPIQDQTGLGQSCRLLADMLKESGIPFCVVEYHSTKHRPAVDHTYDDLIVQEPKYNINIFHINAHEFTMAFQHLGKQYWDGRYNIAFWLWELEVFPKEWVGCIDILDEVWTPAEFVSNAIRKVTDKPVRTVPYAIKAPTDAKYDRKYFNLPEDKFLFLMMYDKNSMMERKNPIGALEAFKKAFKKDEQGVGLVIKMNGKIQEELDYISNYLDGYTNVYFMTDRLSKVEVNSLVADVDVFVSLHRAEGFGLVMAEAMLNCTPCIATNWSANTEFMNDEVACMVDYEMIELAEDIGPFKKGNQWADADVDQAAGYMRQLHDNHEYYTQKTKDGLEFINMKLGSNAVTQILKSYINDILE